jgi:hypothetical protein
MSGERGLRFLVAATVVLPLAALVLLLVSSPHPERTADAQAFESLVGGLGLGTSLDLSRCAAAFDPRDGNACADRHDPLPLGSYFCPEHTGR